MSSRELPGIIPFQVHEHFISTFVSKWEKICLDSFYKMDDILKAATELLCKKHFGRFSSSGLLYEVRYGNVPNQYLIILVLSLVRSSIKLPKRPARKSSYIAKWKITAHSQ